MNQQQRAARWLQEHCSWLDAEQVEQVIVQAQEHGGPGWQQDADYLKELARWLFPLRW